jgi:ABC-2 type transport system ATP-binding protein
MPPEQPQPTASGPGHSRGERPALEITDVRKSFAGSRRSPARLALDGVSLSIPPGQWVALLGPNGSGKSTLVRIISGVLLPDAGEVRIGGDALGESARAAQRRISVVFQKPGLDPLLTVRENLRAAAALTGLTGADRDSRISELAERLGLADRLDDRVRTLSGGYARRVDLARALLHRPELLILDEPTAGLDHQSRSRFLETIAELRRAEISGPALSILMSTHLMDEAELADRVVMMSGGRIVADGSPGELRGAGGERIIRAGPLLDGQRATAESLLVAAGLRTAPRDERTLLARAAEGADVERAVLGLARSGIPFEVAPPNLGDAYLAITGATLEAGGAS